MAATSFVRPPSPSVEKERLHFETCVHDEGVASVSLLQLPAELIAVVYEHLCFDDVLAARGTCARAYEIGRGVSRIVLHRKEQLCVPLLQPLGNCLICLELEGVVADWLPRLGCCLALLLLWALPVAAQDVPGPVPEQVAVAPLLQPEVAASRRAGPSNARGRQDWLRSLAYPLAVPALQIDPWGWRYSESRAAWRMHTGVDFAAPAGTPVLASLGGRVVLAENLSGYGLTVVLDHGQGLQTLYAHLQSTAVTIGERLEQGQELGQLGMTGAATGPHLHFELRSLGNEAVAHDPTPHLPPLLPPPALTATRSLP